MRDAWLLGFGLTLIINLLSSLQGVNADETLFNCNFNVPSSLSDLTRKCPKGFICCDKGCCLEKKMWDPSDDPFRILFIIFMIMIPLLCICGFVRHFCQKCREPEQNLNVNHQIAPEAPSIASLEMIWVTTLDPPPPYSQVIQKSIPTEPPPPYSLRPANEMRGTDSPAF